MSDFEICVAIFLVRMKNGLVVLFGDYSINASHSIYFVSHTINRVNNRIR